MPIYEYICEECKSPFEKLVFKSGQPVECPSCGSSKSQMQLSVFRTKTGPSSSGGSSSGGCGCTPSSCGCN